MQHTILIVDDSPLLRATARRAALQAGLAAEHVREAQNGKTALEDLARQPADLVLLDLNMPVMDGMEFVERKAAIPALAGVHVALLTSEGRGKWRDRMHQLGVVHYLHKPIAADALRALLGELFGASA